MPTFNEVAVRANAPTTTPTSAADGLILTLNILKRPPLGRSASFIP